MRKLWLLLSSLSLAWNLACSSSSPAPSVTSPSVVGTGLAYVDPIGTGWRLVRDSTSTDARLVLNLMGPAGLKSRGAGFNLKAPAGVRFGTFATQDRVTTDLPVKDTGVYQLLNTTPTDINTGEAIPTDPLEPKLLAGGVKKGNLLTVGIFQKDRREGAKDSGTALCQIVLEFDVTAGLLAGDAVALTITKAKYMAEDVGEFSIHPTKAMAAKAHLVDMPVALGVLRVK